MHKPFAPIPRPILFAHRGASHHAPENTWESFDLALSLGADVIEMDVRLAKDGEVMVIHDARLERTTDGHGLVREYSCRELLALDAGYRFVAGPEDYRFRNKGVRIPRLAEVLVDFGRRGGFNIELKDPGMVRPVLDLLAKAGPIEVLLAAGDNAIMAELEAAKPGCALGLSSGQAWRLMLAAWGLGRIPPAWHGRALQVPPTYAGLPVASRRVVAAAHQAGIDVHLWTLDDATTVSKWLERGVDGVMSNEPAALAGLFRDAKQERRAR